MVNNPHARTLDFKQEEEGPNDISICLLGFWDLCILIEITFY